VILDYLWGPSAERMFDAISGRGEGRAERRIRYVQIGSVAAPGAALSAITLRSSGIELLGSGVGSLSSENLIQVVGALLKAVVPARLTVDAEPVSLSKVETAWNTITSRRIVFTV